MEQKAMPTSPERLLEYLGELGIKYVNTPHAAVFTAEEGEKVWKGIAGMHCKNLFCKDAKGKLWLIVAPAMKRVDLKSVPALIGSKRLSFGGADLLFETLGVFGGSVTPFSVVNDAENRVTVVLDKEMMAQDKINFHPLVNTATTTVAPDGLMKFLRACRHEPVIAPVCEGEA